MAISDVSELKKGYLYKFECDNSLGDQLSQGYIFYQTIGYIRTNKSMSGSASPTSRRAFGYYGNSTYPKMCLLFNEFIYYSVRGIKDFVGSFYFTYDGYTANVSNLLPYITLVKDYFITDRTEEDVIEAKRIMEQRSKDMSYDFGELKGCLNIIDLGRISANTLMIRDDFISYGYSIPDLGEGVSLSYASVLTESDMQTVIDNIKAIANNTYYPVNWETMTTELTYQNLNAIERNLYRLREAITSLENNSLLAGTFNAYTRENEYNILPKRR